MYECWDKFEDLLLNCPHHGCESWWVVSSFDEGTSPLMKQLIDNMSGGYSMNQRSKKPLSSYKVPLERSSASKFFNGRVLQRQRESYEHIFWNGNMFSKDITCLERKDLRLKNQSVGNTCYLLNITSNIWMVLSIHNNYQLVIG